MFNFIQKHQYHKFIKTDTAIIAVDDISDIDCSDLKNLNVLITTKQNKQYIATKLNAIELVYLVKPSSFEGLNLKWPKFVWFNHNVFAHPIMQILAVLNLYKFAFFIHDVTIPKPIGKKDKKQC